MELNSDALKAALAQIPRCGPLSEEAAADLVSRYLAALPKQEPSNDQQGCCPCENPLNHIEGCRNAHNSPK